MALGPFDKRVLGKRCLGCKQRHLKCEGLNCKACRVAQRKCVLSVNPKQLITLDQAVNHAAVKRNKVAAPGKCLEPWHLIPTTLSKIPKTLETDPEALLTNHFYISFLKTNSFTGRPRLASNTFNSFLESSPALSNVAMAISSMLTHGKEDGGKTSRVQSLQFYRQAVVSLQTDLQDQRLNYNHSVLWSTFFLGLFELMSDATGDGWMIHFLHGTSELLNHFGPSAFMTEPGREFFLTIRVFEISRALLFTRETFLSQPKWQYLTQGLWNGKEAHDWHPKEALFDIIISCSALGLRSMKLVGELSQLSLDDQLSELHSIAAEGLGLRISLQNWKDSVKFWNVSNDDQMLLALIYYHAISIYLSGIFDYFSHWDEWSIPTPTIERSEIQENVQHILTMTTIALKQSNLAGILFLFPLRVAGARVDTTQNSNILWLLGRISQGGFVVANTIAAELGQLWSTTNSNSVDIET